MNVGRDAMLRGGYQPPLSLYSARFGRYWARSAYRHLSRGFVGTLEDVPELFGGFVLGN